MSIFNLPGQVTIDVSDSGDTIQFDLPDSYIQIPLTTVKSWALLSSKNNKEAADTSQVSVTTRSTNTANRISSTKLLGGSFNSFKTLISDAKKEVKKYKEYVDNSNVDSAFDDAEYFTISQIDASNVAVREFRFALLPAIQSVIGGTQTPEVKPGILKRLSQNIKTFQLPGGAPAFQMLGSSPTIFQLVGLITGAEGVVDDEVSNLVTNSKGSETLYTNKSKLTARWYAEYFETYIVQQGRPVRIAIKSPGPKKDHSMFLDYVALIQDVRHFFTRSDRIYFSIDALILEYEGVRTTVDIEATSDEGNQGPQPETTEEGDG